MAIGSAQVQQSNKPGPMDYVKYAADGLRQSIQLMQQRRQLDQEQAKIEEDRNKSFWNTQLAMFERFASNPNIGPAIAWEGMKGGLVEAMKRFGMADATASELMKLEVPMTPEALNNMALMSGVFKTGSWGDTTPQMVQDSAAKFAPKPQPKVEETSTAGTRTWKGTEGRSLVREEPGAGKEDLEVAGPSIAPFDPGSLANVNTVTAMGSLRKMDWQAATTKTVGAFGGARMLGTVPRSQTTDPVQLYDQLFSPGSVWTNGQADYSKLDLTSPGGELQSMVQQGSLTQTQADEVKKAVVGNFKTVMASAPRDVLDRPDALGQAFTGFESSLQEADVKAYEEAAKGKKGVQPKPEFAVKEMSTSLTGPTADVFDDPQKVLKWKDAKAQELEYEYGYSQDVSKVMAEFASRIPPIRKRTVRYEREEPGSASEAYAAMGPMPPEQETSFGWAEVAYGPQVPKEQVTPQMKDAAWKAEKSFYTWSEASRKTLKFTKADADRYEANMKRYLDMRPPSIKERFNDKVLSDYVKNVGGGDYATGMNRLWNAAHTDLMNAESNRMQAVEMTEKVFTVPKDDPSGVWQMLGTTPGQKLSRGQMGVVVEAFTSLAVASVSQAAEAGILGDFQKVAFQKAVEYVLKADEDLWKNAKGDPKKYDELKKAQLNAEGEYAAAWGVMQAVFTTMPHVDYKTGKLIQDMMTWGFGDPIMSSNPLTRMLQVLGLKDKPRAMVPLGAQPADKVKKGDPEVDAYVENRKGGYTGTNQGGFFGTEEKK